MDIAVNQVNALTYSDLPLPGPRVIRLLKLIDEPEISSMPCCALEVVDLDANPSCEALSYTWGSPIRDPEKSYDENSPASLTREIAVNGKLFWVTENLFDALIQLSLSGLWDYLWIDAICISQAIFDERDQQIQLMGDIYASAKRVVVWLGKDTSHLEDFMWIHGPFYEALAVLIDNYGAQVLESRRLTDPKFQQELGFSLRQEYGRSAGSPT